MRELIDWAHGYCAARGYAMPVPTLAGEGVWFDVGREGQIGRFVLGNASPELRRAAFAAMTAPGMFAELAAPRDTVLPDVPPGWTVRDPAWLMRIDSPRAPAVPPPGYDVELHAEDMRSRLIVRAGDGAIASQGTVGLAGRVAVYDQIATDPAHARRGLATVVMAGLAAAAVERDIATHLLIATADGRALYAGLGWSVASEVVSVVSA